VEKIAGYQPFPADMLAQAIALNVAFLKAPIGDDGKQTLHGLKTDTDEFHSYGREVYWLSRIRQSDSKFSNALFERVMKSKATFRGVNTIMKLAAKYPTKDKTA